MTTLQKYSKRHNKPIVAVQLNLITTGFTYEKWGHQQLCKPGDWLVNNEDEIYTIDQETFAATYKQVSQGLYIKYATVWAEQATEHGTIQTKEGFSNYEPGDWLVYNQPDRGDDPGDGPGHRYCMKPEKFQYMYVPVHDPRSDP